MKKEGKKKEIIIIMVILLIISIILVKTVYGLSFKFNVKANKEEVKAGEEITISMEIAEIEMGNLRNKCNRRNTRI